MHSFLSERKMRHSSADILTQSQYLTIPRDIIKESPISSGVLFCNEGKFIGFFFRSPNKKGKFEYVSFENERWYDFKEIATNWYNEVLPTIEGLFENRIKELSPVIKEVLLAEKTYEKYETLKKNRILKSHERNAIDFTQKNFEKKLIAYLLKEINTKIEVIKNCLKIFLAFYETKDRAFYETKDRAFYETKDRTSTYDWEKELNIYEITNINHEYSIILHYYFLILALCHWIESLPQNKTEKKDLLMYMKNKSKNDLLTLRLQWLIGDIKDLKGTRIYSDKAKLLLPKLFFCDDFDNFYENEFEALQEQINKYEIKDSFPDLFIIFQDFFTKKDIIQKEKLRGELDKIFDQNTIQYIELLGYALSNLM